jgi:PAS domain S-box-containing protein
METQLLCHAIEHLSSPCFIKDKEGLYIYINHAAARLAGLTPKDFLGRNDIMIFGEEVGRRYQKKDQAILQGQPISPIDNFTDSAGITRIYFITREVILDDQQLPCGILGIRTDITDHLDIINQHNRKI